MLNVLHHFLHLMNLALILVLNQLVVAYELFYLLLHLPQVILLRSLDLGHSILEELDLLLGSVQVLSAGLQLHT